MVRRVFKFGMVSGRAYGPIRALAAGLAIIGLLLGSARSSHATHYQQIYSFAGQPDGANPRAPLLSANGLLYSVALGGGIDDRGVVYSLTPPSTPGGSWTESVLWRFGAQVPDGESPSGNLIIDQNNNLYGTTQGFGSHDNGTAFELSPSGSTWSELTLWNFDFNEGRPSGGLFRNANGILLGVGLNGGPHVDGTVFALPPGGNQIILASFPGESGQPLGFYPNGGLLPAAVGGGFFGTVSDGGASFCGTVFQLDAADGASLAPIYSFKGGFGRGSDGCHPTANVISDKHGVLYGVAGGGDFDEGIVYSLTPPATSGGVWTETILYSFGGFSGDGAGPQGPLALGPGGVLYGTTQGTAENQTTGTIFSLTPPATAGNPWVENILHTFGSGADGFDPESGLTLRNGILYGTAQFGGAHNSGSVFGIAP